MYLSKENNKTQEALISRHTTNQFPFSIKNKGNFLSQLSTKVISLSQPQVQGWNGLKEDYFFIKDKACNVVANYKGYIFNSKMRYLGQVDFKNIKEA